MNKISDEMYNLLRNISATLTYLDKDMIRKLNVTLICPRLEYASVTWSPSLKKYIRTLERIENSNINAT